MTGQCQARVQFGTSTYAMRNKERQCANAAVAGGYCHTHQKYNITPMDRAAFQSVLDQLKEQK